MSPIRSCIFIRAKAARLPPFCHVVDLYVSHTPEGRLTAGLSRQLICGPACETHKHTDGRSHTHTQTNRGCNIYLRMQANLRDYQRVLLSRLSSRAHLCANILNRLTNPVPLPPPPTAPSSVKSVCCVRARVFV